MATTFNSVEQRVNDLLAPPVFNEDDTISKELLKLSLKERNALEEEIHGVRSLNPDETPHLVDRSLRDFDQKLLLVAEERQRTREKKILTLHGFDNSECFKSNDVLRNKNEQPFGTQGSKCYRFGIGADVKSLFASEIVELDFPQN
ncbi:unnamed protein product [Pseudo-nitzschia multistriata]|uniref:Uncharacterized protein n=1 Tax=Pseudo-nitzschia multistriata TaxID=183589 RepID=A0A448Z4A3_9STRA|nr:unnamed protein product [Pseudo-nitzschia multistriata]